MLTGLTFHHIGLAVKTGEEAVKMLAALGYTAGAESREDELKIYARFCTAPGQPTVEIVRPIEGVPGPVDNIVSKYNELIYHTCYETPDLAATLAEIEAAGFRCMPLGERKKSNILGGRHVSFYKIFGWGILELLERN